MLNGQTRKQQLPYPFPRSEAVTSQMRANTRKDTRPEIAIRGHLHAAGRRFRKDMSIRCNQKLVRPDIVFTRQRIAVFVDGCFWHRCSDHFRPPTRNLGYWVPKIARNVERDRESDAALLADGWDVVRVWEHEDPAIAAARIDALLAKRDI